MREIAEITQDLDRLLCELNEQKRCIEETESRINAAKNMLKKCQTNKSENPQENHETKDSYANQLGIRPMKDLCMQKWLYLNRIDLVIQKHGVPECICLTIDYSRSPIDRLHIDKNGHLIHPDIIYSEKEDIYLYISRQHHENCDSPFDSMRFYQVIGYKNAIGG